MHLHYGDLNDSSSLVKIIATVKPTEIYNLGAMSHVKVIDAVEVSIESRTSHSPLIRFHSI